VVKQVASASGSPAHAL